MLITEKAYNWNIKKRSTTRYISADQIRLAFTGSINKSNSFQYIKLKVRGELTCGGGGGPLIIRFIVLLMVDRPKSGGISGRLRYVSKYVRQKSWDMSHKSVTSEV